MNPNEKFQHQLRCVCNSDVLFDIIEDIGCDWGSHIVAQCPNCEELFSIDKKCIAFQTIEKLLQNNPELYSKNEINDYLSKSHPC